MTAKRQLRRPVTIALALAATVTAISAAQALPAHAAVAGTAEVQGGTILYEAAGGVANDFATHVGNTLNNEYRLTDAAGDIVAGAGCRQESLPFESVVCAANDTDPDVELKLGNSADRAQLTLRQVTESLVDLGTGNDIAEYLSGGPAEVHGRAGQDTIQPSIFVSGGLFGPASFYGEDGGDTIESGRENDVLRGGAGQDKITGGLGADLIEAGLHADVVFANDGIRDVVDCGNGLFDNPDTALLDAFDANIACENTP